MQKICVKSLLIKHSHKPKEMKINGLKMLENTNRVSAVFPALEDSLPTFPPLYALLVDLKGQFVCTINLPLSFFLPFLHQFHF
ncbi:hypothetical protein P8452_10794 [Trifolium repens]|nr:hypothetical protein P8452_10794 [Trifolium repens]